MRLALTEFQEAAQGGDETRRTRAWKLFLLLPRLLLFRPARGGLIAKSRLLTRFSEFSKGHWLQLLIESRDCAEVASQVQRRRRRTQQDTPQRRADRAETMVQLGELSAGRQALEAAPIAPGNMRTLSALTDIERRPPEPRAPIPADILNHEPESALELDQDLFFKSLKSARKGAAGGPSGMTVEHLRPLLDESERC